MLEEHYQKIVDVENYRLVRESLLINHGFSNDNILFDHLINKNISKDEKKTLEKYQSGFILNDNEQELLTELLNRYPN